MARFNLPKAFEIIPEGTYTFKITAVEYDDTFGEMRINLITKDGRKHRETYRMQDANGNPSDRAYNAFAYFARVAMDDFNLEDIDTDDLVGHYIRCSIVHREGRPNENGETRTFANLGKDKEVAYGWDDENSSADLSSLLD